MAVHFEGRLLCASLMEETVEAFLAVAREMEGADLLEIRVDGLRDANVSEVKRLLRNLRIQTKLPLLLTNRWEKEGGEFPGNERERIEILLEAQDLADLVDIELRSEERLRDDVIAAAKEKRIPVIVSHHDRVGTPEKEMMIQTLEEAFEVGADLAKLAVTARSRGDVLRLLEATHEASSLGPIATLAMGETGRISRIAAPFFGSRILYVAGGSPTAPGQLSLRQTKEILALLRI
jgi:3-dehydroquinate dehydratase-1